ncbi:MAG: DUF4097 family beta strand repeat-containing protein [Bacteroides sp.]|nr:DUF4097 family beta strand repeat-containing protein [Bacillota bacterium]MCM1394047.1 DUF4097 family beta strand repeat-containing protein [[Eubacterium] siraeum]MCM1455499.1 DUF4097 family beta strand repeat-containing protein [Bacteroides sp.]
MKALKHGRIILIVLLVVAAMFTLCACDDSVSLNYGNANAYTVAGSGEIGAIASGGGSDSAAGGNSAANVSISELEIEWINGDISIVGSDTAQTVSFQEEVVAGTVNNDTTMHYYQDANVLRIKYAKSGRTQTGNLKKNLLITVPASLNLWKIDVENVSGKISVACDANKVEVESVSGNADVSGRINRIDVETVSGQVVVNCDANLAELDVETVSGNVLLKQYESMGFRLEYGTISGQYNEGEFAGSVTRQGKFRIFGNGRCDIDIETISGSLTLEKIAAA